jgi:hypothetical protein
MDFKKILTTFSNLQNDNYSATRNDHKVSEGNDAVCSSCNATGIVPCKSCDENTLDECQECYGIGESVCEKCEGKGSIMEDCSSDPYSNSLNITSNYDSVNDKTTLTVTASGSEADELASLLKLSGVAKPNTTDIIAGPVMPLPAPDSFGSVGDMTKMRDAVSIQNTPVVESYVLRLGSKFLLNRPHTEENLDYTKDVKDAAKYTDLAQAKKDAVLASGTLSGYRKVKVVPVSACEVSEGTLTPERKNTDISKDWDNTPNEQIIGWKAIIDNADGPNNPKAQHKNYRMGDNPLTVEKNNENLHEDTKINSLAENLLKKFHTTLNENVDYVYNAILHRVERTIPQMIRKYGMAEVEKKAREIADNVGDVDSIEPQDLTMWIEHLKASFEPGFNECSDCIDGVDINGNECPTCYGSGKFAVGTNADHYL